MGSAYSSGKMMTDKSYKILVTGAGGFLGKALAKKLVELGHEVFNYSRHEHSELDELGIKSIQGNLTSLEDLLVATEDIDVVFHTASLTGIWGDYSTYYNTNVVGTESVIEACRQNRIKYLIYTSTPSVVFGKDDLCGVDESQQYPEKYLCNYAATKAMAERKVLSSNDGVSLKTIALRPHLIWGPGDPHLIPRLVKKAREGKLKIVGNGNNLVDVTFVDNAVAAHLQAWYRLMEGRCCGNAYFIGQEKPVFLWNFINDILSVYELTKINSRISLPMAYAIGSIFEFIFKVLGIKKEPPMTRFVALQLGKSHYFSHNKAINEQGYNTFVTIENGMEKLSK